MSDEKISFELEATIKVDDALKKLKELEESSKATTKAITSLREQLVNLSEHLNLTLDATAKAMLKDFENIAFKGLTKPSNLAKPDLTGLGGSEKASAKAAFAELKADAKNAWDFATKQVNDYKENLKQALREQNTAKKQSDSQFTARIKGQAEETLKNQVVPIDWKQISQDATQGTQQFIVQVDKIKQKMIEINTQTGAPFKVIAEQMKETKQVAELTGDQLTKTKSAITAAATELTKGASATNLFSSALSKLKLVLAGVFGLGLIQILRGIWTWFNKGVNVAIDFSQSLFKLEASVRALQRTGVNVTIKETVQLIKELRDEFGVFNTQEVVEGIAQVQLLTRNFRFTKEEMKEVFKIASTLAIVLGKDFSEAAKSTALFLSSGYAESMQRAGLAVNRLTVQEEAHRLGIEKGYTALTEQERAHAGLSLVLREIEPLVAENARFQNTYAGKIRATTKETEDYQRVIATRFIPTKLALLKILLALIKSFAQLQAAYEAFSKVTEKPWWEMGGGRGGIGDPKKIKEQSETVKDAMENVLDIDMSEYGLDLEKDLFGSNPLLEQEKEEDFKNNLNDLVKDLIDIQENGGEKRLELEEEFLKEMDDIDQEFIEKSKDNWENYQEELADIQTKEQEDVAKENQDLLDSVADLNHDTQTKISDANKKYREQEIKAERDHQEKLRRLREEYLFDLEDALRARDALQILRLMRRYKLDKEQLGRQKDTDKQDRADSYKDEISDIKKQAAEKLKELQIEHQRRLEEIRIQAAKEREEARIAYDEKMAELSEQHEAEKEERKTQYDEDIEELRKSIEDQLTDVVQEFIDANDLVKEQIDALGEALGEVFGEGGAAEGTFNQFGIILDNITKLANEKQQTIDLILGAIQTAWNNATSNALANVEVLKGALTAAQSMYNQIAAFAGMHSDMGTLESSPYNNIYPNPEAKYASGVKNKLLTRPQLFLAGEIPEIMNITPVSQLSSGGSNGNGKGTLEILLGSGLEANIIDNTLGEFDMILRRELGKKS